MTLTPEQIKLRIRASSADRAFHCAASVLTDESIVVDNAGEVAALGTAVHDWCARKFNGSEVDAETIAKAHGVELSDLLPLIGYAADFLAQHSRWFYGGQAEVSASIQIGDVRFDGTADLVALDGATWRVADFKSGWKEPDAWRQMIVYLWLRAQNPADEADTFEGWIVWLRDRTFEKMTFTRDELNVHIEAIVDRVRKARGSYSPGQWCDYCWRRNDCPGLREHSRRSIAMLSDGTLSEIAWTPETRALVAPKIVGAVRTIRAAMAAGDRFLDAVKADIITNGPIESADGSLKIVEQQQRQIVPDKAWPVLAEVLSQDEMVNCVKISITAVERAVAAKAPKGQGAAAKRAIATALDDAQAIEMEPRHILKEV